jgi:hypothetical protein
MKTKNKKIYLNFSIRQKWLVQNGKEKETKKILKKVFFRKSTR